MKQHYAQHSGKRLRRRERREAEHGPERVIVRTVGDQHRLDCGHWVTVADNELPHIKRRRCFVCLARTIADRTEGEVVLRLLGDDSEGEES